MKAKRTIEQYVRDIESAKHQANINLSVEETLFLSGAEFALKRVLGECALTPVGYIARLRRGCSPEKIRYVLCNWMDYVKKK